MRSLILSGLLLCLLSACVATPKKDLALERVKNQLSVLKADESLVGYAPIALGEAERMLRQAELSSGNTRTHLLYMADRRIQVARALAQQEQMKNQYDELEKERNRLLVLASQKEAEQARLEAERARMLSAATAEEAERARRVAETARLQEAESERTAVEERERAALALAEAERSRRLAEAKVKQAELARKEAELVNQKASKLEKRLEYLQLRQTESGTVLPLGDALFASGQATLKPEAQPNLREVVELLQVEPDKKVRIEGHTDSVGDAAFNQNLSERRARAVRDAVVNLGVNAGRITVLGLGEDFPIADNNSADGRRQNRRVDVILLND